MNLMAIGVLVIFFGTLIGLIRWQQHSHKVFGVMLLLLYVLGFISTSELLSNSINTGVVTLLLLVSIAVVFEQTYLLQRLSRWLLVPDFATTWLRVMGSSALFSSMLNNTAIVSMLLGPLRNNPYHANKKLILPMTLMVSFAGMLTLIGTSTNVIVNTLTIAAGFESFSLFDFFPVAAIGLICSLPVLWLQTKNFSVSEAIQNEAPNYLVEASLLVNSKLIGKTVADAGLRHLEQLYLSEIIRSQERIYPVSPDTRLMAGDILLFSGDIKAVSRLNHFHGLVSHAQKHNLAQQQLTEVLILPESILVGSSLKSVQFRSRFNAAVIAIRREGRILSGALGGQLLQAGDYLVLMAGADFWAHQNLSKNFLFIKGQTLNTNLSITQELFLMVGFFGVIGAAALGQIELLKGLIVYLGFGMATGLIAFNEIRRRLPIALWLTIVAALSMVNAIENSGLMDLLENVIKLQLKKKT